MYELKYNQVMRTLTRALDELARCHDVYRLAKLTRDLTYDIGELADETYDMVRELEETGLETIDNVIHVGCPGCSACE